MIVNDEQKNRNGLLINITGNGKGKTTSALGTCLRAIGWGWKTAVIQFIKDSQDTGERKFAETAGDEFNIFSMGAGFTWRAGASIEEDRSCAEAAWDKAEEFIASGTVDLLVLDELNIALHQNFLDVNRIISVLKQRPQQLHIIITGRNCPDELAKASDLVSEVCEIKHPFQQGITAQKGIDF